LGRWNSVDYGDPTRAAQPYVGPGGQPIGGHQQRGNHMGLRADPRGASEVGARPQPQCTPFRGLPLPIRTCGPNHGFQVQGQRQHVQPASAPGPRSRHPAAARPGSGGRVGARTGPVAGEAVGEKRDGPKIRISANSGRRGVGDFGTRFRGRNPEGRRVPTAVSEVSGRVEVFLGGAQATTAGPARARRAARLGAAR